MLDPHQMVLSSVPDKLLIMTYLHQIKQYFTTRKTTAEDHGEDDDDVTLATIVEAERSLRLNTETLINDIENNDFTKVKNREAGVKTDTSKGDKMDTSNVVKTDTSKGDKMDSSKGVKTDISKGDLGKVEYEANPGYNPFDDDEPIAEDRDVKTKSGDTIYSKGTKQNDNVIKDEHSSDKLKVDSTQNPSRKMDKTKHENCPENNVQGEAQHSPEKVQKLSPREEETTGEDPWKLAGNDALTNKQKIKGKDTASSKPERLDVADNKLLEETVLYSPKPGYNPFLDEDAEGLKTDNSEKPKLENEFSEKGKLNTDNTGDEKLGTKEAEKTKSLNPFDEDYIDDGVVNTTSVETDKSKSLNPFDDDYEEPFETDLDEVLIDNVVKAGDSGDSNKGLGTSRVDKSPGTSEANNGLGTGDVDKSMGTNGVSRGPEINTDKRLGATGGVLVGNTSPRINSNRLETQTDNRLNKGVSKNDRNTSRTLPETTHGSNARTIPVKSTENVQISQMHRKEARRPGQRPATLADKVCTYFIEK